MTPLVGFSTPLPHHKDYSHDVSTNFVSYDVHVFMKNDFAFVGKRKDLKNILGIARQLLICTQAR